LLLLVALGFVQMAYVAPMRGEHHNQFSVESIFSPSQEYISIVSNADFATYATSGNGQEGTPWIIEDYVLSNAFGEIIDIEGTTDYFIIENCTLDGISKQFESIFLYNVQNGEIRNCTMKNNRHSIFVRYNCQNIYIHDNTVFASDQSGIRIYDSQDIVIENNNVYDHQYNGIWFWNSPRTYAWNNTVSDCETGIWAFECGPNADCEIIDNNVYGCDNAIYVNATTHTTIHGNYVFDMSLADPNLTGVSLNDGASNNTITNNTIFQCVYHGLLADPTSHNNTIMHNSFVRNNLAYGQQALDNGTDNIIDYNFWDEWTTPDESPADGIVDLPYILDGTGTPFPPSDSHPVTTTPTDIPFHFVGVPEVIFPNGGELINDTATIMWKDSQDSQGHSINFTAYYSPNNGADWYELIVNTTETFYDWDTELLTKGDEYLVKVIARCSDGLEAEDTSDGTFTLQAHTMTNPIISYPNGGESISGTIDIVWSPAIDSWQHDVTYTVFYSDDDGVHWFDLVTDYTETSYEWDTSTVSDGDLYLIKVLAECSEGTLMEDNSDAVFSIGQHELSVPTVIFPNGGELINDSLTILWTEATDSYAHSVTYAVSYSFNAGTNWIELSSHETGTSYVWDTTAIPKGSDFLVKVIANCSEELIVEDVSDATFTLQAHTLSTPDITYPTSGAALTGTVEVTWTASVDSWGHVVTYSLYYATDGVTWVEIDTGIAGTSYDWDTTAVADGSTYTLKLISSCSDMLEAESISQTFSVENEATTTTTTEPTTPEPPPDNTMMIVVALGGFGAVIVVIVIIVLQRKGTILSGGGES
jgi:parallel beta-helix repeat protein